MDKQQIFNTVAQNLLIQNECSWNGEICLYRGPNGLKCAAGVLIPDELYQPEMEGHDFCEFNGPEIGRQALLEAPKPELWNDVIALVGADNIGLIKKLQKIHDQNQPEEWTQLLNELAEAERLDKSVLNP